MNRDAMLDALADTVRAVFGARAVSVYAADPDANELVFAAVAGQGADSMPGQRIPADTGIAGWVFAAGQPLVIEDVTEDPRFAADYAETTGYLPKGIMTAPILGDEGQAIGVISVLDRPRRAEFSLVEVELLERFCHLVALVLQGEAAIGAQGGAPIADLAAAVASLPPRRRSPAERLLDALTAVLEA
jgi:GAF domain-containing protein